MDDEDKYRRYAHLPIPTYEEATSSRPSSSHDFRGPQEISADAERQGLLGQSGDHTYRPPNAESARSSEDSNLDLPEVTAGDGDYDRRQIEELDYLDPSDISSTSRGSLYHRARLRQFSKHLANLSATFSSIRLPSFRSLYSPVQNVDAPPPRPRRPWLPGWSQSIHIPEHYKMSAPIFARLCGLFTIAAVIYILFALDMFPRARSRITAYYEFDRVRQFVIEKADTETIQEYLEHITNFDHVAGTEGDYYLASWMEEKWDEWEVFDQVTLLDQHVYLNYPTREGRGVKITEPESKRWTAQLEEDRVDRNKQQTLSWHGHSKSGDATGHLVYANRGSKEDFQWLQERDVDMEGAIALVRYYGHQSDPGLKIKAAEHAGCVGVLMFSDPSADGAQHGDVWPDGRWRPEDSVQREGVGLTNWIVGDPLTPGWPSKEQAKTISKESSPGMPRIPSLPIAWRDAKVLLDALDGLGVQVPNGWTGGIGNNRWYSGAKDSDDAPIVELRNHNDENEKQRIWNVHGLIQGFEQPKKKVMVGSHHDSWCFGAVDPGSATAVMMEVVSIFAGLVKAGWRPLRTIQFASWDATEFNLMGSTEFVEEELDYLYENGVAYINVDTGAYGQDLVASASPLWRKPLNHALNRVVDPATNDTLRKIWNQGNKQLSPLDARGDYVAFQNMAGMSSINIGFEGPRHGYPRHSCYETMEWMTQYGDPNFEYHRTLARVWALLILEMADRPLMPFDLKHYAEEIQTYINNLQNYAIEAYSSQNPDANNVNARVLRRQAGFDLTPLRDAAKNTTQQVAILHGFEEDWNKHIRDNGPLRESRRFALERINYNNKVMRFESDLLDLPEDENDKTQHGIPGREQYKHVIFGPTAWDTSGGGTEFPAVRDAVEQGDWEQAQRHVEKAARILQRAGRRLLEMDSGKAGA